VRQFKLSRDPEFVPKLRDIVGLYIDPPAHAMVLSIDEKSQIQALDRTQPGLPLKPGRCGTMTHDYKRNGTTTLFAALDVLEGKVIGRCMQRHRHQEFIRFLNAIEAEIADSGERDQPYRLKVITDSGDCDHVDHERLKPGVMVATLHAADISVGCMGIVGPVKSAADRPRSPWRGPRAPRSALASDGAARAGRRCGPPWAIGARAVMQRGFRQRQDVGARMVP
jgi:hypothetical protein